VPYSSFLGDQTIGRRAVTVMHRRWSQHTATCQRIVPPPSEFAS
jgi:hypothetical protein